MLAMADNLTTAKSLYNKKNRELHMKRGGREEKVERNLVMESQRKKIKGRQM